MCLLEGYDTFKVDREDRNRCNYVNDNRKQANLQFIISNTAIKLLGIALNVVLMQTNGVGRWI